MGADEKSVILVVDSEEAFIDLIQYFQADRYAVLFAAGAPEAIYLTETRAPVLMVIRGGRGGGDLAAALKEVQREPAPVIGLAIGDEASDTRAGLFDVILPIDDMDAVVAAARTLLKERRRAARVGVDFFVTLRNKARGVARTLSNTSMLVLTEAPFEKGERTWIELGWADSTRRLQFIVGQIDAKSYERPAVVFLLPPEDTEGKAYLQSIVSKILEVEHYLHATQAKGSGVRGPAGWRLGRRAERSSQQIQALRTPRPTSSEQLPAVDEAIGGRYLLSKKLRTWGVGDVHLGLHKFLQRPCWVKLLRPELKKDREARSRMENEARIGSALANEPGVVDVIDFGEDGKGGLFYALEALEGETLASAIAAGRSFGPAEIAEMGYRLASAVRTAHWIEHVHGDLCPEHIFLPASYSDHDGPLILNFAGSEAGGWINTQVVQGIDYRPAGASTATPAGDVLALGKILFDLLAADAPQEAHLGRLRLTLKRAAAGEFKEMGALVEELSACHRAFVEPAPVPDKAPVPVAAAADPSAAVAPAASAVASGGDELAAGGDDEDDALEAQETGRLPRPPQPGLPPLPTLGPARDGVAGLAPPATASPVADPSGAFPVLPSAPASAAPRPPQAPGLVDRARAWLGADRRRPILVGGVGGGVVLLVVLLLLLLGGGDNPAPKPRPTDADGMTPSTMASSPKSTAKDAGVGTIAAARRDAGSPPPADGAVAQVGDAGTEKLSRKERREEHLKKARSLARQGRYDDARAAYSKAIKLWDSASVRRAVAKTHERQGKTWNAIWHMRKAVKLSRSPSYMYHLGLLLLSVNNRRTACNRFRDTLRRRRNHAGAKRQLAAHCK